jgi:hypothetical protein
LVHTWVSTAGDPISYIVFACYLFLLALKPFSHFFHVLLEGKVFSTFHMKVEKEIIVKGEGKDKLEVEWEIRSSKQ